jgi:hypothetical protein
VREVSCLWKEQAEPRWTQDSAELLGGIEIVAVAPAVPGMTVLQGALSLPTQSLS